MSIYKNYIQNLHKSLLSIHDDDFANLENLFLEAYRLKKNIFFCGNGGSAGNANHIVNDFLYGVRKKTGEGFRIKSLVSNQSVITCLANDCGYEDIFSEQLAVYGDKGDLLVCLSGSGNSKNIINVIECANKKEIKTISILGYDGGKAKEISDYSIHLNINDMQFAEDFQLIIFHALMQSLFVKLNES
jgi:D-sedoheptulose 7-phosphate isomerase